MAILVALVLTVLPGSWIIYGIRPSGIPKGAKLPLAIALSPPIVGLQLVLLEAIGIQFEYSAYILFFLNLPCTIILLRDFRRERFTFDVNFWKSAFPTLFFLVGIPLTIWFLIPGFRVFSWNSMIHTDIVYAIARDGLPVEETNLAGLNLAYGWIGHGYWTLISWIGDWAPTVVYPFTNFLWIIVTFLLSYQIGKSGLGLQKTTALLGAGIMFLGTNVIGMVLLIVNGYNEWWEQYFGDIRYTPFLSKFYGFEVMIWGMALLVAIVLVYTIALRTKVKSLDGLTVSLLVGLGLIYPVLFPAGLIISGCSVFLLISRIPRKLPEYTGREISRIVFALLISILIILMYLGQITSDRAGAPFSLSEFSEMKNKFIRIMGALGPFIVLAIYPLYKLTRHRSGPELLMASSAFLLSAVYIVIDLAQLEYKYVLAATICLAFLAVIVVDTLFFHHHRARSIIGIIVLVGLAGINLLLVFKTGSHVPGNLSQAPPLDESSFQLSLSPSDQDSDWTRAIQESTTENTVIIARKPGVQLSVLVGRSMYVPSDSAGGQIPGYNLKHRSHLIYQRGYPEELYNQRIGDVDTLYMSEDESKIEDALHRLKELQRPLAIHFTQNNTYSLNYLGKNALGKEIYSDSKNIVWLIDDPNTLP